MWQGVNFFNIQISLHVNKKVNNFETIVFSVCREKTGKQIQSSSSVTAEEMTISKIESEFSSFILPGMKIFVVGVEFCSLRFISRSVNWYNLFRAQFGKMC